MAKKPANSGKHWTRDDKHDLRELANHNTPTGLIAYRLKRTPAAVQEEAEKLHVTLKPVNKSPYNRRKP